MIRRNKFPLNSTIYCLMLVLLMQSVNMHAFFRKKTVPDWVNTQLSDPDYFVGIGSAPIYKKQNTHVERARKDALNELASEISVQLFSSNVLVTLVRNDKIKDEFNSLIRSRVSTELDGYELVSTYADKKNYWVYYRLSKQKYYEQQQLKRQAAVQNAVSYFKLASDAEKNSDFKQALVNYAKTVDAVKLYLNENIVASIDNKEENLIVQSFARLNAILSSLKIEPLLPEIHVMSSGEINRDKLTFRLVDEKGELVSGFPLLAHYSERAIQPANMVTNEKGEVQFSIGKIRSLNKEEVFRVMPDVNAILVESSADFVVRKAILDMSINTLSVPVHITKPSIRFVVKERNVGVDISDGMVGKTFANLGKSGGYISENSREDYVCIVETDTKPQSFNNGIYTSLLTGNIVVTDNNKKIKYIAEITPVKGMQLSPEKAGIEAYNVFVQQINTRYFREIEEAILK